MMHMPWVLVVLIFFLVLVVGGVFVAVRVMGSATVKRDHPGR